MRVGGQNSFWYYQRPGRIHPSTNTDDRRRRPSATCLSAASMKWAQIILLVDSQSDDANSMMNARGLGFASLDGARSGFRCGYDDNVGIRGIPPPRKTKPPNDERPDAVMMMMMIRRCEAIYDARLKRVSCKNPIKRASERHDRLSSVATRMREFINQPKVRMRVLALHNDAIKRT